MRTADPSSRGVLPIVCVIECDQVQQPSTPTMNGWTRDEVRLRKKERNVHDVCMDFFVIANQTH
jgi:hypothetical protein